MDESSGQKLEVDHVVPFSKGGSDDVSNLAAVHAYCNRRKSATNMYPIWVDGALLETAGQSSTARSRVPGWWERLTPFDGESRNNRRWNQLNPSLTIDRGGFAALLERQGNRCSICGNHLPQSEPGKMHLYHLAPTGTGEADSEARPVVVHPQCSLLRLENTRGLNSAKRPPSATRSIRNSGRDFRSSRLPPSSHASNRGQAGKWLLAVIGFVVLLVAFASILQLGGGFGEPAPIDDGCDDPSGLGSSARSYDDAPGAVRCLEISDVTEDSIALTWFPPINAGSVGVDHYEVKRAIRLFPDERSTVTSTSFVESGLDSATEYRYTVRAFSIDGSRGPEITIDIKTLDPVAATATATTPATDAAPGAVRGLKVAATSADSITLTWDPPLNRYTVPVDRYEVIRSVRLFGDERQFVTETTFTDIDLDPDSKYEYRVRAHSADGVEGSEVTVEAFTLEVTTTTPATDAAPGAVRGLKVAATSADSITLTWDPPLNRYTVPVDRYEVIRSVRLFGDERQFVTETTFTDIDLDPDSKYEYRVRAHSADGVEGSEVTVEAFTLEVTTTTPATDAAPGAVRGLKVAAASG